MKTFLWLSHLLLVIFVQAQTQPNILDFHLLRQDDEINITSSQNLYQKIKSISLGDSTSLSLGGSYRFQTESFIHEGFVNDFAPTDYWFLHRAMAHAHLKVGSKFQLFAEINSSTTAHKEHTSPVDKDELNINQLFAKYNVNNQWSVLLGRQNVRLGSSRLVDVREGPNVRLSFDMAELQYHKDKTNIQAFYAIPVQQKHGIFDNNALDTDETLSAFYWTQKWQEQTNTDVYVLYKEEKNKTWNAATADDKRTSIGVRTFGQWLDLKYNNEFIYQLGKFGHADIHAWTISFDLSKNFQTFHPFTFGVKAEAISGDEHKDDGVFNTFDGLYPRGAYFGRVAYFGPSNLIDIHPYFKSKIGIINLELDYEAFWRYSTKDGIYNPALILTYPANNDKKFLANQIGIIGSYTPNKYISLEIESNIIFPGEFLKQSNQDKTLYHFVLTTQVQF